MDWVGRTEDRGNAGETAHSFFHPSGHLVAWIGGAGALSPAHAGVMQWGHTPGGLSRDWGSCRDGCWRMRIVGGLEAPAGHIAPSAHPQSLNTPFNSMHWP